MNKTIFALSTLLGKSGVAVIRISGEDSLNALIKLGFTKKPLPNRAYVSKIFFPESRELLDEGIIIYFQSPYSFTGEDVVELHLHGSIAVISDAISALNQLPFLRPAEAGEFTKRAFLNNKIDLTKAEGLSLLLDAETSMQRRLALNQLQGNLETLYEKWRKQLINILAKIEAFIDFPEDEIPQAEITEANHLITNLVKCIEQHLSDGQKGEVLFKGINVAIIGAPNVGKSSLLNAIAKRDVAIVSHQAGTTRDIIELRTDLNGYPVTFFDTAGIRETSDIIEAEGVNRALTAITSSDILLVMFEGDLDQNILQILYDMGRSSENIVLLFNKSDIHNYSLLRHQDILAIPRHHVIEISTKTGYGMENFMNCLTQIIKNQYHFSSEPIITKARYRKALIECCEHLREFNVHKSLELAAEDLRIAAYYIGTITGRIDVEEILEDVFSNFCIGK